MRRLYHIPISPALRNLLPYPIPKGTCYLGSYPSDIWEALLSPSFVRPWFLTGWGPQIGFTSSTPQARVYKAQDMLAFTWGDLRSYLSYGGAAGARLEELALFLAFSDNPNGMLDYMQPYVPKSITLGRAMPYQLQPHIYALVKSAFPDFSQLHTLPYWLLSHDAEEGKT